MNPQNVFLEQNDARFYNENSAFEILESIEDISEEQLRESMRNHGRAQENGKMDEIPVGNGQPNSRVSSGRPPTVTQDFPARPNTARMAWITKKEGDGVNIDPDKTKFAKFKFAKGKGKFLRRGSREFYYILAIIILDILLIISSAFAIYYYVTKEKNSCKRKLMVKRPENITKEVEEKMENWYNEYTLTIRAYDVDLFLIIDILNEKCMVIESAQKIPGHWLFTESSSDDQEHDIAEVFTIYKIKLPALSDEQILGLNTWVVPHYCEYMKIYMLIRK